MEQKYKIGIAFSGGGARGIAHLGVLDAMHDRGIEPQVIAGTSMGAIVGCFYAAGYTPKEILEEIKKEKITKFLSWKVPGDGLLDLENMEQLLRSKIPTDDFSALRKPLYVAVSNLNSGEYEIIHSGPLFKFIIASASIPIVFKPILIDGNLYVDGGLLRNLPAKELRGISEKIIGVNVNLSAPMKRISGIKQIAERCLRLGIESNMREDLEACDLVIRPLTVHKFNTFDFRKADAIYQVGYEAMAKTIDANQLSFA